jgi:proliferating cell nuclear antigen
VPPIKFSSIINLPSSDFQKIIRDMSSLSDKLEIKCVGDELIFSLEGPFATVKIQRSECNGNLEYIKKQDITKVIQGEFSLKHLSYFIKCTNLCNSIELMLENDIPLVVKYNVASLGEIKLCLIPIP